ncbi:alpha carbonic anhydrase 4-like isoform X2 [Andrographis paniculata]|uniref:alpha carbonic anhydrase 4-like isoform X2 n=1 Tax=Andrographis paniculata TaxID=175694 RepID=UPI0021E873AE|nr:alpha carbonic anhydrase 4-like isoform X2 [Andrographis paniculata]
MWSVTRRPDLLATCLLLYLLLPFGILFADESEVEDESEFTYTRHSEKGPENWANINPHWKACGSRKLQSPIDLVNERVEVSPMLGGLKRTYKPAPAVIKNRGHDITVTWQGDAGGVVINRTEYQLLQCHWHTPSEHTVDEKRFKMEIHLVHKNLAGQISVVGILYKLGRPDPFLAKLLENIKTCGHKGTNIGVVDPWDIKFGSRKYFRYVGSLTVPPCTEGVLWTILKKVRTVSQEQMRALRDAVHDGFEDNARPIQRNSGTMPVYMYRPGGD